VTRPRQVVRIRIGRVVIDAEVSPDRRSRVALMEELQDAVRRYLTAQETADARPGHGAGTSAGSGSGGLDSAGWAVARAVRGALGPGTRSGAPPTGGQGTR
jgi:hypothetical protein